MNKEFVNREIAILPLSSFHVCHGVGVGPRGRCLRTPRRPCCRNSGGGRQRRRQRRRHQGQQGPKRHPRKRGCLCHLKKTQFNETKKKEFLILTVVVDTGFPNIHKQPTSLAIYLRPPFSPFMLVKRISDTKHFWTDRTSNQPILTRSAWLKMIS